MSFPADASGHGLRVTSPPGQAPCQRPRLWARSRRPAGQSPREEAMAVREPGARADAYVALLPCTVRAEAALRGGVQMWSDLGGGRCGRTEDRQRCRRSPRDVRHTIAGPAAAQDGLTGGTRRRDVRGEADKWVPRVRTDEKKCRNGPCFNIR
jgi:hypothetical protein